MPKCLNGYSPLNGYPSLLLPKSPPTLPHHHAVDDELVTEQRKKGSVNQPSIADQQAANTRHREADGVDGEDGLLLLPEGAGGSCPTEW